MESISYFRRLAERVGLAKSQHLDPEAEAEFERQAARRRIVDFYLEAPRQIAETWIKSRTETANFYYDLTDLNKKYLSHWVSIVTNVAPDKAARFIDEALNNVELSRHLQNGLVEAYPGLEIAPFLGRRLGWYAVARASRPQVIVETGVDHGVGACTLAAALLKNAEEGYPGRYYGLDIGAWAGRLLTEPYSDVGEMIYGDSIETLRGFPHRIDLLVNDSDHDLGFERREFETAAPLLSPRAIVLGDNCHAGTVLADWATETGRKFLFFAEKPINHWYPGAGIGAAFDRS